MSAKAAKRPRWIAALLKRGACAESVRWASKFPTFYTAWKVCRRPDWMRWWLDGGDSATDRLARELELLPFRKEAAPRFCASCCEYHGMSAAELRAAFRYGRAPARRKAK